MFASRVLFLDAFEMAAIKTKTIPFFFQANEPKFTFIELPFNNPALSTELKNSYNSQSKLNQALAYQSCLNTGTFGAFLVYQTLHPKFAQADPQNQSL